MDSFQKYVKTTPIPYMFDNVWDKLAVEERDNIPLSDILKDFGRGWNCLFSINHNDGYVRTNEIPYSAFRGLSTEQKNLLHELEGMNRSIYSYYLPSDRTGVQILEKVRYLVRDGNQTEIIACDDQYYYHFRWRGS